MYICKVMLKWNQGKLCWALSCVLSCCGVDMSKYDSGFKVKTTRQSAEGAEKVQKYQKLVLVSGDILIITKIYFYTDLQSWSCMKKQCIDFNTFLELKTSTKGQLITGVTFLPSCTAVRSLRRLRIRALMSACSGRTQSPHSLWAEAHQFTLCLWYTWTQTP